LGQGTLKPIPSKKGRNQIPGAFHNLPGNNSGKVNKNNGRLIGN